MLTDSTSLEASVSGGDNSSVEIVEDEELMSECAIVYLLVWMLSVRGVRNVTFFGAGNIGLDCAKDIRLPLVLGIGPLLRIEVML